MSLSLSSFPVRKVLMGGKILILVSQGLTGSKSNSAHPYDQSGKRVAAAARAHQKKWADLSSQPIQSVFDRHFSTQSDLANALIFGIHDIEKAALAIYGQAARLAEACASPRAVAEFVCACAGKRRHVA